MEGWMRTDGARRQRKGAKEKRRKVTLGKERVHEGKRRRREERDVFLDVKT